MTGSSVRPDAPPEHGDRGRHRVLRALFATALGVLAALVAGSAGAAVVNAPDQSAPEMSGRDPGVVYLTFDDGPDELFTPVLLDLLDHHGARATFFLLGRNLAARWGSDQVQDLLNRGHAVGNHSIHHRRLTEYHPWSVAADLEGASVLIADRTGYRPTCWRAPYGDRNLMVDTVAASLDLAHVGWTADPQEWRHPWVPVVVDYLTRERHDGSIVLLHDRKWLSLHIVEDLLPASHEEGWRFEALPTCQVPGERQARMATRAVDDPPVGRVERVSDVDGRLAVSGWAYDADAPEGGLSIKVWVGQGVPIIGAVTGADHRFDFLLEVVPVDPICLWAIDSGRRQDANLGCHRAEIPPGA
ncbi:MAG: polysaccharide deacetylase family protein [Actinomycetota bacterium]|nr:polysaccharide deacetylase family protein [Actinomycetota bacterium]